MPRTRYKYMQSHTKARWGGDLFRNVEVSPINIKRKPHESIGNIHLNRQKFAQSMVKLKQELNPPPSSCPQTKKNERNIQQYLFKYILWSCHHMTRRLTISDRFISCHEVFYGSVKD